jgi:hypothetical protein
LRDDISRSRNSKGGISELKKDLADAEAAIDKEIKDI